MTRKSAPRPPAAFTPVPVRSRVDGWTPERQTGFIEALAACANVEAAARAVGMSRQSAYDLRARPDAAFFREAWDIALEHAVQRLADAVLERAIEGTVTPIFYKGEQVGERRRYDERLAQFILRLRDPGRFGRWREDRIPIQHADSTAIRLKVALMRVDDAAFRAQTGRPQAPFKPLVAPMLLTAEENQALTAALAEQTAPHTATPRPKTPEEEDAEETAEYRQWCADHPELDTEGGA